MFMLSLWVLSFLLAIFKLDGMLDVSWWMIFMPIWLPLVAMAAITFVAAFIDGWEKARKNRK